MIPVRPAQVTSQLVSLFDSGAPAGLRAFGVLDGVDTRGKIFTDDPANPTWGAAWESGYGTLYLGGSPNADTIHRLVATLRKDGDVLFGFWPGDPVEKMLPPNPDYVGTTLDFLDRPADEGDLKELASQSPSGCELRRMDADLLPRCLWYEDTVRGFGSVEAFLSRGIGVCLLRGDEILSEAYAGPSIRGARELGAITAEAHRGHGYATFACAQLILLCQQESSRTWWNCATGNKPSAAVARKLGYRLEKEYHLLAWFKSET